jgi:hypothetical protein
MRFAAFLSFAFLVSCGSDPKPSQSVQPEPAPKVADSSSVFPKDNLTGTEVVPNHLLGKAFMPGGTLAHYKKGKVEFDMFVTKLGTATDSAILLPDWRKALTDAKLVPSFGGYFGNDAGRPVFVFTKGPWVAGVAGLPLSDADTQARPLAAALKIP